jgi:polyvinyl alcohol dehydrogenase (cytochrome)
MYQHDLGRSGYNPNESQINATSAPSLAPKWTVKAADVISSEVVPANGLLYWGSWDGYEHASDPATGTDIWKTYLGDETKSDCSPPHLGVASTADVTAMKINGRQTLVLFVGGGQGSYYALNAKTGNILWSHFFGSPQQGFFMWSSPVVFNGSVYLGVSSIGDCPLVPGEVVKLNATSGAQQAAFTTVPPGCGGAGVWSSPTIDQATGDVFVTTGTDGGGACGQAEPYAQAFLEFSKSLSLIASWKPNQSEQVIDGDFGGTPTLFSAAVNGKQRALVGAANKNGIFYALDRSNLAAGPMWESAPVSTEDDLVASSAWDGRRLYVAGHNTVLNGASCEASVRAIDPSSGAFLWSTCTPGGAADAAVTAIPGLVLAPVGSVLYVLDAGTGQIVFQYQDTSFHWFYGPAVAADGALYIGNSDDTLFKFTPGGA